LLEAVVDLRYFTHIMLTILSHFNFRRSWTNNQLFTRKRNVRAITSYRQPTFSLAGVGIIG